MQSNFGNLNGLLHCNILFKKEIPTKKKPQTPEHVYLFVWSLVIS